jgi:hypothetical protein
MCPFLLQNNKDSLLKTLPSLPKTHPSLPSRGKESLQTSPANNSPQMEMEIWRYVNMEILYQQADNFQFSIFQFFNLSTGSKEGS